MNCFTIDEIKALLPLSKGRKAMEAFDALAEGKTKIPGMKCSPQVCISSAFRKATAIKEKEKSKIGRFGKAIAKFQNNREAKYAYGGARQLLYAVFALNYLAKYGSKTADDIWHERTKNLDILVKKFQKRKMDEAAPVHIEKGKPPIDGKKLESMLKAINAIFDDADKMSEDELRKAWAKAITK